MGTEDTEIVSEATDKLLKCELCSNDFDTEKHRPLILPCYHSFCESCLDSMKTEVHFHCPSCQRSVAQPGSFPVDTTRVVLLDMRRSAQGQAGITCQGCTEGKPATSRCLDCAEFLCNECHEAHNRVKLSKEHHVVSMAEAAKNPAMFKPAKGKCERHPSKELDLYCNVCGVTVCATCALTRHKDCRDIVELESILEDKKKELSAVCTKLGTLQHTFNGKVAEAEACIASLEETLTEAEQSIRQVFEDIAAANADREAELLDQLREMGKQHRKSLEEQLVNFRSMTSSADVTSEYGKRLISMNLGPQILNERMTIQSLLADLSKKTTQPVKKAPKYKFCMDKVPAMKGAIKKFGDIGVLQDGDSNAGISSTGTNTGKNMVIYTQTPCVGLQDLRVTCPVFALDTNRLGPGCSVSPDSLTLSNEDCPSCSAKQMGQPFKFKGSCATSALPMQTCYWQAHCNISVNAELQEGTTLCEVGVATQQALQAGIGVVTPTNHCAVGVWLYTKDGAIVAQTYSKRREICHTRLTRYTTAKAIEQTLGFLMDPGRQRFFVIDVTSSCLLCECGMEVICPLWPFVNVVQTMDVIGADVRVLVQTGPQITITPTLARLIHSTVCSEAPSGR